MDEFQVVGWDQVIRRVASHQVASLAERRHLRSALAQAYHTAVVSAMSTPSLFSGDGRRVRQLLAACSHDWIHMDVALSVLQGMLSELQSSAVNSEGLLTRVDHYPVVAHLVTCHNKAVRKASALGEVRHIILTDGYI